MKPSRYITLLLLVMIEEQNYSAKAQICNSRKYTNTIIDVDFSITEKDGLVGNISSLIELSDNASIKTVHYPVNIFSKADRCNPEFIEGIEKQFSDTPPTMNPMERERCRNEMSHLSNILIESFGHTQIKLIDYCAEHSSTLHSIRRHGKLEYLLPNQAYLFTSGYRCNDMMEFDYKLQFIRCTPPGPPRYQPQTDHSSFRLYSAPPEISSERRVDLYWKPVPHLLRSSDNFKYHVSCCYSFNLNGTQCIEKDVEPDMGLLELDRGLQDVEYRCSIRSTNEFGESDASQIVIPPQKSYLYLPDLLKLYINVSKETFRMNWPRLHQHHNNKIHPGGHYVIYHCTSSSTISSSIDVDKCTSIEILHRSPARSDNEFTINLTRSSTSIKSQSPGSKKFGISFRNETHSTGINWAGPPCNFDKDTLTDLKPVTVSRASYYNSTAVSIKISIEDCDSIIAAITKFELTHCKIGPTKLCADGVLLNETLTHGLVEYDWNNKENCVTTYISNDLFLDLIWNGLILSTRYKFRLRYHIREIQSRWSNPMTVDFADKKSSPWFCQPSINLALVILALFFLSVVLGKFITRKCMNFIHICKEAEANVPQRLKPRNCDNEESWSEIGLKYWLQADPDLSDSQKSCNDCDSSGHGSNLRAKSSGSHSGRDDNPAIDKSTSSLSDDYIQIRAKPDISDYIISDGVISPLDDQHQGLDQRDDRSTSSYSSSFLKHILDPSS